MGKAFSTLLAGRRAKHSGFSIKHIGRRAKHLDNPAKHIGRSALLSGCAALLSGCLLSVGCTPHQLSGVATGSTLGGMFGSSIGGVAGGWRGHDLGGAIGMLAGGAVGAAVTGEHKQKAGVRSRERYDGDDVYGKVEYGSYREEARRGVAAANAAGVEFLEVTALRFSDADENHCLNAGERAFLSMEIYNRGDRALSEVAPQISCDNRRIAISPTAIMSRLEPGQGFRYRAEIIAPERLQDGFAVFTIAFGSGKNKVTAKTFRIRTGR